MVRPPAKGGPAPVRPHVREKEDGDDAHLLGVDACVYVCVWLGSLWGDVRGEGNGMDQSITGGCVYILIDVFSILWGVLKIYLYDPAHHHAYTHSGGGSSRRCASARRCPICLARGGQGRSSSTCGCIVFIGCTRGKWNTKDSDTRLVDDIFTLHIYLYWHLPTCTKNVGHILTHTHT